MPLRELSVVDQRETFVTLALADGATEASCAGISASAGRPAINGLNGIEWRAARVLMIVRVVRTPSPSRTADATAGRGAADPGGQQQCLGWTQDRVDAGSNGWQDVPALSTITEILRRHGKLDRQAQHPGAHIRFERAETQRVVADGLQGAFSADGGDAAIRLTCSTITRVILFVWRPAPTSRTGTVRDRLTMLFRRYGLPFAMLMDNGLRPWGDRGGQTVHHLYGVADAAWHPDQPWASVSSADAR